MLKGLCKRRPSGVQSDKVRCKHNNSGAALMTFLQELHIAIDRQALLQQTGRRMPQPSSIKPRLSKSDEDFARQRTPLSARQRWETQCQINLNHPAAGNRNYRQQQAQHHPQTAQPA
jgi:hypothetical protein